MIISIFKTDNLDYYVIKTELEDIFVPEYFINNLKTDYSDSLVNYAKTSKKYSSKNLMECMQSRSIYARKLKVDVRECMKKFSNIVDYNLEESYDNEEDYSDYYDDYDD